MLEKEDIALFGDDEFEDYEEEEDDKEGDGNLHNG